MRRGGALRLGAYLQHVADAISHIAEYTSGMELPAYLMDRKTQDAVIRNIEVIGEACNNIRKHHAAFAAAHPEVMWGAAYEMRNALVHGYFSVDHEIVWRTIQRDLPAMKAAIHSAIHSLPPLGR